MSTESKDKPLVVPIAPRHFAFALDFSECSRYALDWALAHLQINAHDKITLIHTIEKPQGTISATANFDELSEEQRAREKLKNYWSIIDKTYQSAAKQIEVEMLIEIGDPKEVLKEITAQDGMTMLIVGNHGKTGTHREMGSVSDFCLKNCSVPVVVVKEPIGK